MSSSEYRSRQRLAGAFEPPGTPHGRRAIFKVIRIVVVVVLVAAPAADNVGTLDQAQVGAQIVGAAVARLDGDG